MKRTLSRPEGDLAGRGLSPYGSSCEEADTAERPPCWSARVSRPCVPVTQRLQFAARQRRGEQARAGVDIGTSAGRVLGMGRYSGVVADGEGNLPAVDVEKLVRPTELKEVALPAVQIPLAVGMDTRVRAHRQRGDPAHAVRLAIGRAHHRRHPCTARGSYQSEAEQGSPPGVAEEVGRRALRVSVHHADRREPATIPDTSAGSTVIPDSSTEVRKPRSRPARPTGCGS